MKKYVFTYLLVIVSCLSVFAQEEDEDTEIFWTRFGAKAGVNFANLVEGDADLRNRLGINIGAFAHIPISEGIALQPEVSLSGQGYEQRFAGQEVIFLYDYLIFPVLVDIRLSEGFSFQAGPQIGFNVTAKQKTAGERSSNSHIRDKKNFDFAATGGFQYAFPEGLIIQARYARGFNDIRDNQPGNNSVISLSVGYFFNRY